MTSERLKRVTSKIEAAIERLAQLDPEALVQNALPLAEAPSDETLARQQREIEDRDRKIAKLRADIDDISDLKDQEIDRLRSELDARAQPAGETVDAKTHAALQRRYDRLKQSAEAIRQRLDALIERMESADG